MFNMKASISRSHSRKLLQQELSDDDMEAQLPPAAVVGSSRNTSIAPANKPFDPNSPLDTSMELIILILLVFLFFMSFFSVYINIRRFTNQERAEARHHRNPSSGSRMVVKKKGLDSSTISALPVFSYPGSAEQGIIEDCIICLSEFEEGEIVKLIPNCRHLFHPSCVDTWLESHVSCPTCRCTV